MNFKHCPVWIRGGLWGLSLYLVAHGLVFVIMQLRGYANVDFLTLLHVLFSVVGNPTYLFGYLFIWGDNSPSEILSNEWIVFVIESGIWFLIGAGIWRLRSKKLTSNVDSYS